MLCICIWMGVNVIDISFFLSITLYPRLYIFPYSNERESKKSSLCYPFFFNLFFLSERTSSSISSRLTSFCKHWLYSFFYAFHFIFKYIFVCKMKECITRRVKEDEHWLWDCFREKRSLIWVFKQKGQIRDIFIFNEIWLRGIQKRGDMQNVGWANTTSIIIINNINELNGFWKTRSFVLMNRSKKYPNS